MPQSNALLSFGQPVDLRPNPADLKDKKEAPQNKTLMFDSTGKINVFITGDVDQKIKHTDPQSEGGNTYLEQINSNEITNAIILHVIAEREGKVIGSRDFNYEAVFEAIKKHISPSIANPDDVAREIYNSWHSLSSKGGLIRNVTEGRVTVETSRPRGVALPSLSDIPSFEGFLRGLMNAYLDTNLNDVNIELWSIKQSMELFLSTRAGLASNQNSGERALQAAYMIEQHKNSPANAKPENSARLNKLQAELLKETGEWLTSLKSYFELEIKNIFEDLSPGKREAFKDALNNLLAGNLNNYSNDDEIKEALNGVKEYLNCGIDDLKYISMVQRDQKNHKPLPSLELFRAGIRFSIRRAASEQGIQLNPDPTHYLEENWLLIKNYIEAFLAGPGADLRGRLVQFDYVSVNCGDLRVFGKRVIPDQGPGCRSYIQYGSDQLADLQNPSNNVVCYYPVKDCKTAEETIDNINTDLAYRQIRPFIPKDYFVLDYNITKNFIKIKHRPTQQVYEMALDTMWNVNKLTFNLTVLFNGLGKGSQSNQPLIMQIKGIDKVEILFKSVISAALQSSAAIPVVGALSPAAANSAPLPPLPAIVPAVQKSQPPVVAPVAVPPGAVSSPISAANPQADIAHLLGKQLTEFFAQSPATPKLSPASTNVSRTFVRFNEDELNKAKWVVAEQIKSTLGCSNVVYVYGENLQVIYFDDVPFEYQEHLDYQKYMDKLTKEGLKVELRDGKEFGMHKVIDIKHPIEELVEKLGISKSEIMTPQRISSSPASR